MNSEYVLGGDCLTNSGELIKKGYDKYKYIRQNNRYLILF